MFHTFWAKHENKYFSIMFFCLWNGVALGANVVMDTHLNSRRDQKYMLKIDLIILVVSIPTLCVNKCNNQLRMCASLTEVWESYWCSSCMYRMTQIFWFYILRMIHCFFLQRFSNISIDFWAKIHMAYPQQRLFHNTSPIIHQSKGI